MMMTNGDRNASVRARLVFAALGLWIVSCDEGGVEESDALRETKAAMPPHELVADADDDPAPEPEVSSGSAEEDFTAPPSSDSPSGPRGATGLSAQMQPKALQPLCTYSTNEKIILSGVSGYVEHSATCSASKPHIMSGGCRITSNQQSHGSLTRNHPFFAGGTDDGWLCGMYLDPVSLYTTYLEVRMLCCDEFAGP